MATTPNQSAFDLNASPDALLEEALASGQAPFTGRQIVTFKDEFTVSDMAGEMKSFGRAATSSDFGNEAVEEAALGDASSLILEDLRVAILVSTPDAGGDFVAAGAPEAIEQTDSPYLIEPETFAFAYAPPYADTQSETWGLQATNVLNSQYSGAGIKVAVLDTGMDLGHPDYAGRPMTSMSFIPGQSVHDGHGHGTHCIGTACGPLNPNGVQRYGIAYEAEIFAGKVLANSGAGSTGGILQGMNWAIANRCEIISMSLGGSGGPYGYYNAAMQRAIQAGCLVIAATGNDSSRPFSIRPTGAPANSPGAFAVGALDHNLHIANFSNGGKVEIAAPGVGVFSSLPRPRMYASWSGTSMATPHVAGIAALLAHSDPALRGAALAQALSSTARSVGLLATDVGSGLVQAT